MLFETTIAQPGLSQVEVIIAAGISDVELIHADTLLRGLLHRVWRFANLKVRRAITGAANLTSLWHQCELDRYE